MGCGHFLIIFILFIRGWNPIFDCSIDDWL